MPLDRSKLHKGFQTYLANAEKASGRSYDDFHLVLSNSGLKKHGELRSHLMEKAGLGHGHANAVVAIWLQQSEPLKGAVKATPEKKAAKPVAKKAAVKKPAKKAPARKK